MQAPAEAQETEAEDEGLVLLRRIHELEGDVDYWRSLAGWGYGRRGNAYKRDVAPKPIVPAIDIPPVAAQMRDD